MHNAISYATKFAETNFTTLTTTAFTINRLSRVNTRVLTI